MKIFWATLGGLALKLLLVNLWVLMVATILWILVPAAFAITFTFLNALAVTGLALLVKLVFK